MAKTHKHLWQKVVSLGNLMRAANLAMRGKRSLTPAAGFFSQWELECVNLCEELEDGSYQPGAYRYFKIYEPKERMVAAAPFRDRVVHHALVRVLEPLFEPRFLEDSFACRKGKGTHAGMRRALHLARRHPYALKCDLKRYFPSIDHGVLTGEIARVVADPRVMDLINPLFPALRSGPTAVSGASRQKQIPSSRSELVRKSRYLHKNSGFVRELVANMAIYSTGDGIRVQSQTANPDWNRGAEEYFALWSARCEITRRFSFEECQALVCRGMDIDGEYFIHKTRDGEGEPRIQLIESHRIGDDLGSVNTIDGVGLDVWGAPIFYRVLEDGGKTRDLPATAILHIHEPEWAGGVRSHPTIQHSINHVLDEMELLALEKHAVKDNADVSRILKTARGEIDDNGDFVVGGAGTTNDPSDPVSLQRIVGGKLVALKPDESLDSFQSNRPSPTFTGFLEHLRRDAALGVIPFEFAADSSKIGGAGVRLIVAKADRRFSFRQMILERRLIRPIWTYVIGDAINRGLLPLIAGWWKISTVPPKRVTVDAGREAQQNRADVEMGLKTLSDHYAELGADFGEEIERRASDAKMILETAAKYGVPVDMLWKPSGTGNVAATTR